MHPPALGTASRRIGLEREPGGPWAHPPLPGNARPRARAGPEGRARPGNRPVVTRSIPPTLPDETPPAPGRLRGAWTIPGRDRDPGPGHTPTPGRSGRGG